MKHLLVGILCGFLAGIFFLLVIGLVTFGPVGIALLFVFFLVMGVTALIDWQTEHER